MDLNLFKTNALKYLNIDNEIKKLKNIINEKKKEKDKLKLFILQFMNKNKLKDLNTQDGKLKYTITKSKKPLNKIFINKTISEYLKDEVKAKELTELLYKKREQVQKIDLRRTIKKKKN